ncbi:hypothetical protein AB0P17_01025 [Streptomyces sp. NPDC088124]|uniref:hypothetical protein n=1 Tax=Streptomyces sp. NPDC088124 TaxID=3154654 RepID=UPI003419E0EC
MAVALGSIGLAAEGLGYLLINGVVVLAADVAIAYVRRSRRAGRRAIRRRRATGDRHAVELTPRQPFSGPRPGVV